MNITKTILVGLLAVSSGFAENMLQLDISDGVYNSDPGIENTVNTTNPFNLIALLDMTKTSNFEDYYISMAITPQILTEGTDFGTFEFLGNTISESDLIKMEVGTPPYDLYEGEHEATMAPHSSFPTLYYEYGFDFFDLPQYRTISYNVAEPGNLTPDENGQMLYREFAFDLSNLNPGYALHFDLYNKVQSASPNDPETDLDVGDFAPFSHDAEATNVPEPATLSLLGMGLLALSGMGVTRRRK